MLESNDWLKHKLASYIMIECCQISLEIQHLETMSGGKAMTKFAIIITVIGLTNMNNFFLGRKNNIIVPAGFWPRGQSPRRHPRIPRLYTYKDKEDLLKK